MATHRENNSQHARFAAAPERGREKEREGERVPNSRRNIVKITSMDLVRLGVLARSLPLSSLLPPLLLSLVYSM